MMLMSDHDDAYVDAMLMVNMQANTRRVTIKIQTFYIEHFSISESISKQYSPNLESHINYMKQYVRIADFQLHLSKTSSNAKMVFILNVDLDEWNNIGIHDFSSPDPLGFQKPVRGYEFVQN